MAPQILVEDLRKTFRVAARPPGLWGAVRGLFSREVREVPALAGVGFAIDAGELVGYIGPNGAGKSTTVKVLSGILEPDSGRCEVAGRVPWADRVAHVAGIGVVFGQRTQLWWDLPVEESFDLLAEIYRVPAARYRRVRGELVECLDLAAFLDVPVRQLSLGQRMRCDLAAAMLHEPAVLFLDEPTLGLDAASKLAVREFVRRWNAEKGVTVLLTTHDMDDVEALCRRVLVIGDGRVLADDDPAGLRARVTRERRLVVDLREEPGEVALPGARVVERLGRRLVLAYTPGETATAELIAAVAAALPVRDLVVQDPPIEEIVARLYRDLGTGGAG